MIRLPLLLVLLGMYAGSAGAAGADSAIPPGGAKPVFRALDAAQLNQVRAVSRAVLAAKGSQRSSAEEDALLAELHSLAGDVDQALQLDTVKNKPAIAQTSTAADNVQGLPVRSSKLNDLLGPKIARLRERRAAIENLSAAGDDARQQAVTHVHHLSQRAGELEQSLRAVLATVDDTERSARLASFKKQLQPRTLAEWWQDRDMEAAEAAGAAVLPLPTPTMTTLIQHRPGLDELRPGKR